MKKFLALALAIVMMMAMAVPAFAVVDTITQADDTSDPKDGVADKTGSVNVTYSVSETYTVSIPADIELKANEGKELRLSASNVQIQGNQTLKVTVTSANYLDSAEAAATSGKYTEGWYLKANAESGSDNVKYTITGDGDPVTNVVDGSIVLKAFTEGLTAGTASEILTLNTAGTAQVGTYTDQLTFTVAVVLTSSLS